MNDADPTTLRPAGKPLPANLSEAVAELAALSAQEFDALRDGQQNGNLALLREFGEVRGLLSRLLEAQLEINRAISAIHATLEAQREDSAARFDALEARVRKTEMNGANGHAPAE